MNNQLSPYPDYRSGDALGESIDQYVRHCVDCDDVCLVVGPARRCAGCQCAYDDEKHTAARANVARLLDMAIMRQADVIEIMCDECGECAAEADRGTLAEDLDGLASVCPHCETVGKIVMADDDNQATLSFRAYTGRELGL